MPRRRQRKLQVPQLQDEDNQKLRIQFKATCYSKPTPFELASDPQEIRASLRLDNLQSSIPLPSAYTANEIGDIYGFPKTVPQPVSVVIGIISLGGSFKAEDLNNYWSNILKLSVIPTVTVISVDGANYTWGQDSGADMENTLDLEIAGAIAARPTGVTSVNLRFYSAPNSWDGFYNAIAKAIADKCPIISISWGAPESYYGSYQLQRFNALFSSAVQQGINVLVASGDNGSSDGVGRTIHVDFPGSSPNVISCGGTSLSSPYRAYANAFTVETAWSFNATYGWGTGGGVSSYFAAPSWQKTLVPVGMTRNPGKRLIPDIALSADPLMPWRIQFDGKLTGVGGTSCVSPCMAGLLSTYQPKRFVASLLYAQRLTGFHDITKGTNDNVIQKNSYISGYGFDCVTGLGSINGNVFKLIT